MTVKLEEDKSFEIYKKEYAEKDYNVIVKKLNAGTFKLNESHKKDLHNELKNQYTRMYFVSVQMYCRQPHDSRIQSLLHAFLSHQQLLSLCHCTQPVFPV